MRTKLIGCTVAIALAAAACGGSKASALEVVRGAASKTTAARTARTALTVEVRNAAAGGGNVTVSGTGLVDYAAKRGVLDMDLGGAGLSRGAKIKGIFAGTVVYMQI